ncbi:MAG: nucleotidyl transferase AbiEii/AbiGii toxin family protein [Candidatus Shapirobacteria bacterium]|jgi:predicted nucleotidyltransferase component of viral defense system
MSLFDALVDEAIRNSPELAVLRPVVEKELLHHDIMRLMSDAGLLVHLTFIGGTCLRACYGSERLSEDLDFAGGADFDPSRLSGLAKSLVKGLGEKYGLLVEVSEPVKETGNVDTWKVKIQTRPERKDLKAQRINIDICSIPSHESRPMMLRNRYGMDMVTSGLILRAQSTEEILADKFIALAFRPNRIKNRDLWDIAWLERQGVALNTDFIALKIADHHKTMSEFLDSLTARIGLIGGALSIREDFRNEMRRFLPSGPIVETALSDDYWLYLLAILADDLQKLTNGV